MSEEENWWGELKKKLGEDFSAFAFTHVNTLPYLTLPRQRHVRSASWVGFNTLVGV